MTIQAETFIRLLVASLIARDITPHEVADVLVTKAVDIDTYLTEVQTEVANHPAIVPKK